MSDYMDVEEFESDLAQATSKVYWEEESSCMEETFGTVNRVIRELESRVKVLSGLLSERPVYGPSPAREVYAVDDPWSKVTHTREYDLALPSDLMLHLQRDHDIDPADLKSHDHVGLTGHHDGQHGG